MLTTLDKLRKGWCVHLHGIEAHVVNSVRITLFIFATHGLPKTIVSNNGTVFTNDKFATFVQLNGIKYLTSTAQTLKNVLKKESRSQS